MSHLQEVIKEAKSHLDKGFVFVHVKDHWLRTFIDGLEEQQREIEKKERYLDMIIRTTERPYPGETYCLSGHMNAVEYAKMALNKETADEI